MPPEVTTSAVVTDVPRSAERPGMQVVYLDDPNQVVTYTMQPHPPTPRGNRE